MTITFEQSMVVHACNPSTWEAEARPDEFQVCLGYKAKPSQKKKKVSHFHFRVHPAALLPFPTVSI
jgi:hypothetical protein